MGYTHGKAWNKSLVIEGVESVMNGLGIDSMPTEKMVKEFTNSCALNVAISRYGGGRIKLSKEMGIECKGVETMLGVEYEELAGEYIVNSKGMEIIQMGAKYPYDILVNGNIKVDVKVSRLSNANGGYYTFNLGKVYPTCDIFVCYCIDDDNNIIKTYVIPSCVMSGKTQLSVGRIASMYDIYLDKWDILNTYDKFYKLLV